MSTLGARAPTDTGRLERRQLLAGLGALAAGTWCRGVRAGTPETPPSLDDDLRNLRLLDLREGGRRFVLIVPKYLDPGVRLPLLVLLHGLGETADERMGAYAWVERYGLGSAWQRLKRPPITRTSTRGEWTDERLAQVNSELAVRPFRGFILACPFMPKPDGPADLDAYARWIERSLLPRARAEAPVSPDPAHTMLCGVSLGAYVSLEGLVRMPTAFGAWGGVQTAIGTWAAAGYAEKIAKASAAKPLLVLTSTQDHWRASSEALVTALTAKGLTPDYRVIPGPHDQPWLREAGTIETLLWFDRVARYGRHG